MSVPKITDAAVAAAREAIIEEIDDHLSWNVRAYGKAWTGERDETGFIVGEAAEKALRAAWPWLIP